MPQRADFAFPGRRSPRRFLRDDRGVSSIEFVFVFPILILLLCGAVEISNLYSASRKISKTMDVVGDLVAQASTLTQTDLGKLFDAATEIMRPHSTDALNIEVFSVIPDGSGGQEIDWSYKEGSGSCGGSPTVPTDLIANAPAIIVARVCYTYYPILTQIITSSSVSLSDTLRLRPRGNSAITCNDCTA